MKEVWLTIVAQWNALIAAIKDARAPKKLVPDDMILVRAKDGPLIESTVSPHPLLVKQLPARSTKATAKRLAHQFAEEHAGRKLSPVAADRYLTRLLKDSPDLVMQVKGTEAEALEFGGLQTYRSRSHATTPPGATS